MVDFSISVTLAEERRLREFINALRTPCRAQMGPRSRSLNSDEFESEFRSKLLTHHCFMGAPLFQESFDSAFMAACSQRRAPSDAGTSGTTFLGCDNRRKTDQPEVFKGQGPP